MFKLLILEQFFCVVIDFFFCYFQFFDECEEVIKNIKSDYDKVQFINDYGVIFFFKFQISL